jgi:hypothetical protein
MKKLLFLSVLLSGFFIPKAQQCLNISISQKMESLSMPENAAASYKKCVTSKNERSQTVIASYGKDIQDMDTLIAQTSRGFNNALLSTVSLTSVQQPSQQDVSAAKDLAEQVKNMTPEQQKEFAMQMAQQQQKNRAAQPMQDNAAVSKLVYETYDLAVNKMRVVNDEFAAKLKAMNDAISTEVKGLKKDDKTKCPSDITGLPNCDCTNKIEGKYWQQVIAVNDKYDHQKTALFQDYLARIKAMAVTVDNNVSTCKNGDALKSPQLKKMLFSAQSSAFSNAFLVTDICMKDARKEGADAYLNKLNCDANVYDVSCSKR